jgi:quercetin dioxygenase-like cupin family protein
VGSAGWFTGTLRFDPLFAATEPARASASQVTFEPRARANWRTHWLGRTLIVTSGFGRVQRWGGPIEAIGPGDVIGFPPGEKHWRDAGPTTAMTHIAIQEQRDRKVVESLDPVSDARYEN